MIYNNNFLVFFVDNFLHVGYNIPANPALGGPGWLK